MAAPTATSSAAGSGASGRLYRCVYVNVRGYVCGRVLGQFIRPPIGDIECGKCGRANRFSGNGQQRIVAAGERSSKGV